MGYFSEQMIAQQEQGWDFQEGAVCTGCIADSHLRKVIESNAVESVHCDFCENTSAADIDVLVEALMGGIVKEYEPAIEGVSWDGSEGGYQWNPKWDSWDLIDEFSDAIGNEAVVGKIRLSVHPQDWVEKDFQVRRRNDVLGDAWSSFCETIKYRTRYTIWLRPATEKPDPGEVLPAAILDQIGELIKEVGLIRSLSEGETWWRTRFEDEPISPTAKELGTTPTKLARQANRMSPAGLPLFYGAEQLDTAISEATGHAETHQMSGRFQLHGNAKVVDFTAMPDIPSVFDPKLGHRRRELIFMHQFVKQLSEPTGEGNDQVDYVPTQVVTEFILQRLLGKGTVDGVIYKSSLGEGSCVALDISNELCVDSTNEAHDNKPALLLVETHDA